MTNPIVCGILNTTNKRNEEMKMLNPEEIRKQIADKFNIPYMEWTDSLRIWVGNSAVGVVGYASSFLSVLLSLIFFVYFF